MAIGIFATFCLGTSYWSVGHPVTEKILFIIGIALASFGAVGRAWATCYISGLKQKQLVTTGPYSLCRNPLYFFSMLLGIGFSFCTLTVAAPAFTLIILAVLYYFQIRREERRLHAIFGERFESYLMTTPRFFPSYRQYTEPKEITISPRLLKKGLFGIAFLLILIGAIELIQGLHQSQILPNLFHIY